ncbi:octopamine receptor Oamb [Bacillus rossius redtenbacheri]|uniref:octopamine receptor Oamb n=1 Tax=Bacillus rossius redtenbacheri TaxID=93214 RepID=UPI002FDCD067
MREPGMNESTCAALLDEVPWVDPGLLASLLVLGVIDVMVVVGNCLVIAAVFMSSKLRSVTNLFIVSLAVADLMVGVAVLPFSAMWEVFKVWIFGDVWCAVWLALDVWMCTASILNLCAISLDRYLAVTRPVTYPSLMSPARAKALIAGVWVLSFVICFPPLAGWRDPSSDPSDPASTQPPPCPWICELTNDAGYVVYSALGSFYIPTLVMLFFYWRIYRAAVRTTRAINQGFRTTKSVKAIGSRFDEQRLTLRIHRGRSVTRHSGSGSGASSATATTNDTSSAGGGSPGPGAAPPTRSPERAARPQRRHEKIKISVSYPSSDAICADAGAPSPDGSKKSSLSSSSPSGSVALYSARGGGGGGGEARPGCHLRVAGWRLAGRPAEELSPSPTFDESAAGARPKFISKMGRRNIKAQVKRFRMETKAAKTLGIIVGGFICCWLPFFTMYLVRAFCVACIHPLVFSVLFWLGYCNSAINPCIYALFSRDFRFAFKRIICRCLCGASGGLSRGETGLALADRRGSDGSHLGCRGGSARGRSPSCNHAPSCSPHSAGDDSDPNNENSDSR